MYNVINQQSYPRLWHRYSPWELIILIRINSKASSRWWDTLVKIRTGIPGVLRKQMGRKVLIVLWRIRNYPCAFSSELKLTEFLDVLFTSSCLTNCLAVGAEMMIRRAVGEIKPSSTALSMKHSKEL